MLNMNIRMLTGIMSYRSCISNVQNERQHEPTCRVHNLELTFYSETTLSHGRSGLTPILFAQLFCKKQHKIQ